MKLIFMLLALGLVPSAQAESCANLKSCLNTASKITGKTYLMGRDIKNQSGPQGSLELTKENSDLLISYVLYEAGLTRIKVDDKTWSVINARDIRYHPTQPLAFGKDTIPKTYDYQTVKIKLKNPYLASEISRNFRPFISRYGRIIDIKDPGLIIINDTGMNAHRLMDFIGEIDHELTPEKKKFYEQREQDWHKIGLIKAKNCKDK